ncbi:MAG TPA: hypothetical protein PLE30_10745 [Candidatus Kapabacteria bacterium]|nr:hypothetical protein [Candidatus Kapabacteria bacterium]
MKNKFSKSVIYSHIVNIAKILLTLVCCLFALSFIEDIFTTPLEIEFPWEPGGFFYSSVELYVISGAIIALFNMLPLMFIIIKKLRNRFNLVTILVCAFDMIFLISTRAYDI